MTTEALVPIIVKALREISDWEWEFDEKLGDVTGSWRVNIGRTGGLIATVFGISTWAVKYNCNGRFIASSPLWLAQMVVGIVEERAAQHDKVYEVIGLGLLDALRDLSITPKDWAWLQQKVNDPNEHKTNL